VNTLKNLIAALRESPSDATLTLALIDHLIEVGEEDGWQRALDVAPECHLLRMEFGKWLESVGDGRGLGYQAMGLSRRFGLEAKSVGLWEVTHHDNDYQRGRECVLPRDWWSQVTSHLIITRNQQEWRDDAWWVRSLTREELEDRIALAFTRLPPERQQELLRAEAVV